MSARSDTEADTRDVTVPKEESDVGFHDSDDSEDDVITDIIKHRRLKTLALYITFICLVSSIIRDYKKTKMG